MTMTPLRRRGAALAAALLSAVLVLTACGNGDDSPEKNSTGDNSASGYPVTVTTKYGDITLDKKPERIVALGVDFVDILTSLGEELTAFADEGYRKPGIANVPWLDGKVSNDLWDVDMSSSNIEAIAKHNPDLVIAWGNDVDESIYEKLSEVAPVYVPDHTAGADWKPIATEIGLLTGKSEEAKEKIAAVEQTYADAREQLQGVQGKTYLVGTLLDGQVILSPWTFLSDLGLVPADNHPTDGYPRLSMENLDQLQADVVMLVAFDDDTTNKFKSDPRVADLPASKNGTLIYLPANFYGAAGRAAPANMTWKSDQLVSLLEDTALNQRGQ